MTIAAEYENGVFKPLEDVTIDEGTIIEVRVPCSAEFLTTKSPSVQDFAFFGMWKDPSDISDSVDYINKLRRLGRG